MTFNLLKPAPSQLQYLKAAITYGLELVSSTSFASVELQVVLCDFSMYIIHACAVTDDPHSRSQVSAQPPASTQHHQTSLPVVSSGILYKLLYYVS